MKHLPLARAFARCVPLVLLGVSYSSQYCGVLHPVEMCWWHRYPHMAAIMLAAAAFAVRGRPCWSAAFTALAAIAIVISGGIGIFHAGVEYGWWQGLTACSTSPGGGRSADILDQIMATRSE